MDKFLSKEGLIHLWAQITSKLNEKQSKNLVVEYEGSGHTYSTHSSDEICDAAEAGIEVKFFDGYEYLNLLEHSKGQGYAVFYTDYYDSNFVLHVKYVAIGGTTIMMADDTTFNVAYKEDVNKKQDKITGTNGQFVQIINGKVAAADFPIDDLRILTDSEIDEICGG